VGHVGGQVRLLREEKGWTQPRLSVETGLAVSGISQIENGRRNPNAATLARLAGALDVEVADLFPKAQAPLPFEGVEQEQWRSSFMEGWTRYMSQWAQVWEPRPEEEGDALLRRAFAEPEFIELFQSRCALALTESVKILEGFNEALKQHHFLYKVEVLPAISLPQMAELSNAFLATIRVTKKWQATAKAVLDAAPEEVEPRILVRLKEQIEGTTQGYQNVVARGEKLLSA